ncbi:5-demethoxyubiquinol-8 5-hydroxylase UbiM [Inhella sp.]|uniref:5-demethoxyubiquinol-8 5-hydroxylase UbiM n=1 Tax=Inhella sp. TaxID=1921806 RepID=UPI0035B2FCDE
MTQNSLDILIVGGGPAGLALGCALHDCGWRPLVLEQASEAQLAQPLDDGREIALTHRSRRILEGLGLWQRLDDIAPLRRASVRTAGGRHALPFEAADQGASGDLGWLVANHRLRAAAYAGLRGRGVPLRCQAQVSGLQREAGQATVQLQDGSRLSAPLVVAADSRFSQVRRMAGIGARSLDFGRSALLVPVAHEADHQGLAQECFLQGHTLALLPLNGRRCSAVWTVANAELPRLQALDDAQLGAAIQEAAGPLLGSLRVDGARYVYPLVAVYAHRFAAERFALIGDAAVGMHPVTAHGYNLGLYGIEALTQALRGATDPGSLPLLRRYEQQHRRASAPLYVGTNALVGLFTADAPPLLALRRAVIDVARHLPPLRAAITRQLTHA